MLMEKTSDSHKHCILMALMAHDVKGYQEVMQDMYQDKNTMVLLFPLNHPEQRSQTADRTRIIMAYRRPKPIRDVYEERFYEMDTREVSFQRVVNIEKRKAVRPEPDYGRGYDDDQWYGSPRVHSEAYYPHVDYQYFDEHANFSDARRGLSPPRDDIHYYYGPNRDDIHLRRQVEFRNEGRGGPYFRSRSRGAAPRQRSAAGRKAKSIPSHPHADKGEDRGNLRKKEPHPSEDHSLRRETHVDLPVRTIVNTSNRGFSPDRGERQQRDKPTVPPIQAPSSSSDGSPHSSGTVKEKKPASVTETEEVAAPSVEAKTTPEEDIMARRSKAITTKAVEIETAYRQDCETFATVVKMLADKEPNMEKMLQESLDKNLTEMKQRCLDDLKNFIKELDQVMQPEDSA